MATRAAAVAGHTTSSAFAKSYAVFVASYNPLTGEARGGVAGSAFFVSPTKALTAFHVLQPKSFAKSTGFRQTQVWLVHEGEPAIELRAADLTPNPANDMTMIHTRASAPSRYVYQVATNENGVTGAPAKTVETDGFRASSTGPVLEALANGRLRITSVPRLERLHAEGTLLKRRIVELTSNDVNLKRTSCVQLSYQPIVGLSGGPVSLDGRVIAMNSFADPGTRASTWAIDLSEN
jgi:hypothetical protein